ncbi:MAG: AbrB/MazE/SpoVT family DNA-binding domain-containing protein [Nanoarchaeota archaeon]|mgnify:CR=1 FL=1
MERKLIQQGGGGYTIYLPKKWIERNGLNKGNNINVTEDENKLIIEANSSPIQKKVKIDVSGLSPLINRSFIALYVHGVDEIEATFSNKEDVKDFQKRVISELLGFEIIKQTQTTFILKDVTGSQNQDIDELIKRIFLILDSMAEELALNLQKGSELEQVIQVDSSVNRLCHFCMRILNKSSYKEFEKTSQIYGIINLLEEIGDSYKKIAIESKTDKLNKNQIKTISQSRELLSYFKKLIFEFNKKELVECAKRYEFIKKSVSSKDKIDANLIELLDTIIKINNYLLVFSLVEE